MTGAFEPGRTGRRRTSRPAGVGSQPGEGPTVPIGDALQRMLAARGMEEALVLGQVDALWEEVVGPEVARQVHPHHVRDGELVVHVDHPAWATELELAGPAVLARLAGHLGELAPHRLVVRVRHRPNR